VIRFLVKHVLTPWVIRRAWRPADFVVGADNPHGAYLQRWWMIPRNRWFNIYLHCFLRSDDDRALHDHPWLNLSILLRGEYDEHTIRAGGINVRTRRRAGDVKLRMPGAAHRIELLTGEDGRGIPCWTLFITGPRLRQWGFHCPDRGWVHWKVFTAEGKPGEIGPGCDGDGHG
jgi:hypothetical protein